MRTWIAAVASVFVGGAGCRYPNAMGPETESERHIPVWQLSEEEDEWLHDHCAYRGLGAGVAGAPTGQTKAPDANLAEVLYEHDGVADLAVFACRTSPPFIVGGVAPMEERTTASGASSGVVLGAVESPEKAAGETRNPTAAMSPPRAAASADSAAVPPPSLTSAPRRSWPFVPYGTGALVVGVVALGAGTATGLLAMGASRDVHAGCDSNRVCDAQGLDAASKGPGLATASTACFIGAGILAAGGVVLLAIPGTRVKAGPPPQGVGLSLQGAF